MKGRLVVLGILLCSCATRAHAGCIGPEIMGKCEGTEVPWDTHGDSQIRQDAPAGFFYDKRGTQDEQEHPNAINPFTGKDANDSNWFGRSQKKGQW